jgi:hypothetical protein
MNSWMRSAPAERRKVAARRGRAGAGVDVGPFLGEEPHGICIRARSGPHERSRAAQFLARFDVRALREQQLDHRRPAGARSHHQRRLAVAERLIRAGAGFQQQLYEVDVAALAGQRERRHAGPGDGGGVRARFQESRGRAGIAVIRGPVQGGRAIRLRRLDVGPGGDELFELCRIPSHHGIRDIARRKGHSMQQRAGERQKYRARSAATRAGVNHLIVNLLRRHRCAYCSPVIRCGSRLFSWQR